MGFFIFTFPLPFFLAKRLYHCWHEQNRRERPGWRVKQMFEKNTFEVIRHEGELWLTVKNQQTYSDKPVLVSQWWPCRTIRLDWEQAGFAGIHGAEANKEGIESFYWRRAAYDYISFPLLNGGKTLPIKREETPLPTPKTRCETRWYCGNWQKYMKRDGWINIGVNLQAV